MLTVLYRNHSVIISCCLPDDYEMVYQCYHELAKYFQTTCSEDKWISDHFFELALDATSRLKDSDGQLMAEAHCNVGLALKEGGESCGRVC